MNKFAFAGWGRRIRTFAYGSRARCPTARLSPSEVIELGGAYASLQSKSRPLAGLLNTTGPLNLPQKAAEIEQQIQSLLSNPRLCLDPLCNQSLTQLVLKCQPRHPWPAGILLASPMVILKAHFNDPKCLAELGIFPDVSPPKRRIYDRVTDNANESPPLHAPITLPEYVVEVMP